MPVQSIDLSAVTDATFNGSTVEQINLNGTGVWTKPSSYIQWYTSLSFTNNWVTSIHLGAGGIVAPMQADWNTDLENHFFIGTGSWEEQLHLIHWRGNLYPFHWPASGGSGGTTYNYHGASTLQIGGNGAFIQQLNQNALNIVNWNVGWFDKNPMDGTNLNTQEVVVFDEFPLIDMNSDGTLKNKDLYISRSAFTVANSYTGTPDGYTNYAEVFRVRSDRIERLTASLFTTTAITLSESVALSNEGTNLHYVILWDSVTRSLASCSRQGTSLPIPTLNRWEGHTMNYSASRNNEYYDVNHAPCLTINGVV